MQLFYQPGIEKGIRQLDAEEATHCVKVLRKKEGDEIDVVDGLGSCYKVMITEAKPKKCSFKILGSVTEDKKSYHIHIAIAPPKKPGPIRVVYRKGSGDRR